MVAKLNHETLKSVLNASDAFRRLHSAIAVDICIKWDEAIAKVFFDRFRFNGRLPFKHPLSLGTNDFIRLLLHSIYYFPFTISSGGETFCKRSFHLFDGTFASRVTKRESIKDGAGNFD